MHGRLYLAIILDQNEGTQSPLTIALHGGLYTVIIIDQKDGPQTPLNTALHKRPLLSHDNRPE
jgi:hypothetical protein